MKKITLLAMLVVAPALSLAQGGPPPGKGPGAMRMFDPATVVTVTGTVVGESRIDRGMGHSGVHLSVKTAEGEIPVHLGPDFWVDKQTVKLAQGKTWIQLVPSSGSVTPPRRPLPRPGPGRRPSRRGRNRPPAGTTP